MTALVFSFGASEVLPLNAQTFYRASADLQQMRGVVQRAEAVGTDLKTMLDQEDRDIVTGILSQFAWEIQNLDCKVTLASVMRLGLACKEEDGLSYQGLVALIGEIDGRLRDELAGKVSFSLNDFEASYFTMQRPLLGDETFEARHPSLVYDIEEAGKCFALQRHTAAAFHFTRAVEKALLSVCRCLRIPEPEKPMDKTWGGLLRAFEIEMKARWPNSADRMKGDGRFFEQLYVTLDALKDPVRNATNHPDHKWEGVEAYHLLQNSAALLRKVNQRCDERGVPRMRKR